MIISILGLLVNMVGIFVFQHGGHGHSHGGDSHAHSHGGGGNHGHAHNHDSHHQAHDHHDHHHSEININSNDHYNFVSVVPNGNPNHNNNSHSHSHGGGGGDHGHSHSGPNSQIMKGVFLHILADTLGSVGVIISAFLMSQFGWMIADPICSIFIATMIMISVYPLLRDSSAVLMQRSPRELDESLPKCYRRVSCHFCLLFILN